MLLNMRRDLDALHGTQGVLLALWNDATLTPEFDCVSTVSQLLPHIDAIGVDFPETFWGV